MSRKILLVAWLVAAVAVVTAGVAVTFSPHTAHAERSNSTGG